MCHDSGSINQKVMIFHTPIVLILKLVILCYSTSLFASNDVKSHSPHADITPEQKQQIRLNNAPVETDNWLLHGRTYAEERFSPLTQINHNNVSMLGLAWLFDVSSVRGLEATPIVRDGILFTTGTWSVVYAINAKNGELLWRYDPEVPRNWGRKGCCDVVNRGVAVWGDQVFFGDI